MDALRHEREPLEAATVVVVQDDAGLGIGRTLYQLLTVGVDAALLRERH